MARQETDREDLIREAVAFARRMELQYRSEQDPVFCGLRDDGNWSVYFGQDPVFHFNSNGQLRRAFSGGHLLRSQGETLARMHRERTPDQTTLVRHDLNADELETFRNEAIRRLQTLYDALQSGDFSVLRSIPQDEPAATSALDEQLSAVIEKRLPLAPVYRGRR